MCIVLFVFFYLFIYLSIFVFNTMSEIHINGRSWSHNFSMETDDFETSYNTSSKLLVTGQSQNSTIATSIPTNIMDSENSLCGIVFLIFCFCFAMGILIAIGVWLDRKRKTMKTQESQESKVSHRLLQIS